MINYDPLNLNVVNSKATKPNRKFNFFVNQGTESKPKVNCIKCNQEKVIDIILLRLSILIKLTIVTIMYLKSLNPIWLNVL
jgi:hypothetical protein